MYVPLTGSFCPKLIRFPSDMMAVNRFPSATAGTSFAIVGILYKIMPERKLPTKQPILGAPVYSPKSQSQYRTERESRPDKVLSQTEYGNVGEVSQSLCHGYAMRFCTLPFSEILYFFKKPFTHPGDK